MTIFLDDYPMESTDTACCRYINEMNWERISEEAHRNDVSWFDITDSLALFPHLELDENYLLYCYISYEYHGLRGYVAAVRKDSLLNPQKTEHPFDGLLGPSFALPDSSVSPMEAIYHDGTPHGYLEALLAKEFYRALPFARHEQDPWDLCIAQSPDNFSEEWDIYEQLEEWRPRIIKTKRNGVIVSACWRHFENGFGSSDGCDKIRLTQHSFFDNLVLYRFITSWNRSSSVYKAQITNEDRYCDERHCCVTEDRSIIVAVYQGWNAEGGGHK